MQSWPEVFFFFPVLKWIYQFGIRMNCGCFLSSSSRGCASSVWSTKAFIIVFNEASTTHNHTTERRWLVVTAKDRPSLVKCPSHSHIVLCPAVPRSVGWDDDKNKWGGGEGGRDWIRIRAVCSFSVKISLWYRWMQPKVKWFQLHFMSLTWLKRNPFSSSIMFLVLLILCVLLFCCWLQRNVLVDKRQWGG